MWHAIRHRWLQALSVALLAALITACVVFAPIYERAMLQVLTSSELGSAGIETTGLQVSATSGNSSANGDVVDGSPAHLALLVPGSLRRFFTTAIQQRQAVVDVEPKSRKLSAPRGPLVWRDGFCQHIQMTSGRCPHRQGEVAISSVDARTLGLPVGSSATLPSEFAPSAGQKLVPFRVRVVGTYRQRSSDYWFGTSLTGFSGTQDDPQSPVKHDVWLTAQSTFTSPSTPELAQPRSVVDLPLDVSRTQHQDQRDQREQRDRHRQQRHRDPRLSNHSAVLSGHSIPSSTARRARSSPEIQAIREPMVIPGGAGGERHPDQPLLRAVAPLPRLA